MLPLFIGTGFVLQGWKKATEQVEEEMKGSLLTVSV
jgi:hypothetical protein